MRESCRAAFYSISIFIIAVICLSIQIKYNPDYWSYYRIYVEKGQDFRHRDPIFGAIIYFFSTVLHFSYVNFRLLNIAFMSSLLAYCAASMNRLTDKATRKACTINFFDYLSVPIALVSIFGCIFTNSIVLMRAGMASNMVLFCLTIFWAMPSISNRAQNKTILLAQITFLLFILGIHSGIFPYIFIMCYLSLLMMLQPRISARSLTLRVMAWSIPTWLSFALINSIYRAGYSSAPLNPIRLLSIIIASVIILLYLNRDGTHSYLSTNYSGFIVNSLYANAGLFATYSILYVVFYMAGLISGGTIVIAEPILGSGEAIVRFSYITGIIGFPLIFSDLPRVRLVGLITFCPPYLFALNWLF